MTPSTRQPPSSSPGVSSGTASLSRGARAGVSGLQRRDAAAQARAAGAVRARAPDRPAGRRERRDPHDERALRQAAQVDVRAPRPAPQHLRRAPRHLDRHGGDARPELLAQPDREVALADAAQVRRRREQAVGAEGDRRRGDGAGGRGRRAGDAGRRERRVVRVGRLGAGGEREAPADRGAVVELLGGAGRVGQRRVGADGAPHVAVAALHVLVAAGDRIPLLDPAGGRVVGVDRAADGALRRRRGSRSRCRSPAGSSRRRGRGSPRRARRRCSGPWCRCGRTPGR